MDELYQRYLSDPGSVDMAWWNFFADYSPPTGAAAPATNAALAAPASHPGQPQAGDATRAPHGTGSARGEPPGGGPAQRGRPGLPSQPSFCG